MVKHNNVIPNQHFHKKWAGGASGHARGPLHIVSWFDQAPKKKVRRLKRSAKQAAIAPRPTGGALRPVVHCPTIKYNSKVRLGRGFSLEELKKAGIPAKFAKTIGICVDKRRVNKSEEAMAVNVARLAEYKAKLILFPKKGAAKKGPIADSSKEECAGAAQFQGVVMPVAKPEVEYPMMKVTEEMKAVNQRSTMRLAFIEKRMKGTRLRMKKEKEAAKDKK